MIWAVANIFSMCLKFYVHSYCFVQQQQTLNISFHHNVLIWWFIYFIVVVSTVVWFVWGGPTDLGGITPEFPLFCGPYYLCPVSLIIVLIPIAQPCIHRQHSVILCKAQTSILSWNTGDHSSRSVVYPSSFQLWLKRWGVDIIQQNL